MNAFLALVCEATEHDSADDPWFAAFKVRCEATLAALAPDARTLWDQGYQAGFEDAANNWEDA